MTTIYAVGTASVANGGTTVTGVGTSWAGKIFEGDLFTDPAQGLFARVTADAVSNTALSIKPWPGVAVTADPYEILFQADSIRSSERSRQLLEQLTAIEANGRGLFYRFSTTTTDSDPGPGYLRLNNATEASATMMFIDGVDANGSDLLALIDTWDDSSSANKGKLFLRSIIDPSQVAVYNVTAVTTATGYRKVTIAFVDGDTNFAADDQVMVDFARTGDAAPGDVVGPASAVDGEIVFFNGVTGKSVTRGNALTEAQKSTARQQIGADVLFGMQNEILNPDFAIAQRSMPRTASGYGFDRWFNAGGGSYQLSRQTSGCPLGRCSAARVDYTAANSFCNLFQALESEAVLRLQGRLVTFGVKIRRSATLASAIQISLEKSTSVDVVSSGTWTAIASSTIPNASIPIGTTRNDWLDVRVTALVPDDGTAAGLRLRISEVAAGPSGAFYEVTDLFLISGDHTNELAPRSSRSYGLELALCQRFYETGFWAIEYNYNGNMVAPVGFHVPKRVAPSVNYANVANPGSGSQSILQVSTEGFAVKNAGGSTSIYWNANWTADAELP